MTFERVVLEIEEEILSCVMKPDVLLLEGLEIPIVARRLELELVQLVGILGAAGKGGSEQDEHRARGQKTGAMSHGRPPQVGGRWRID